ncbi:MAG TPA: mannosyltransferase family protein [Chloroflexia bacterium]
MALPESAGRETREFQQIPGPDPRPQEAESVNSSPIQDEGPPQETVPMPVAVMPTVASIQEPPNRPPSLRRRPAPVTAEYEKRSEEEARPGIFTTEFRRAMPAWAMPLLTFQPFSVWLGARIGLTLLAILAGLMLPGIEPKGTANWYGSPGGPVLTGFVDRVAGVWTRWDGQWYLKIATEGYRADDGSAAFFPLYPWILQGVGWLAGERYAWAGTLISALFFLAALMLLHRLARLDSHTEDASRTVFYLAAFPMAFFFWAVYSESLFLFLSVAALLAARSQRWWWAAVAISFAIWTRTTGLLLLLPLAWELFRAYRPPIPKDPRALPPPRPHRLSALSLALPVLAIIGLLGWAAATFGDPLASLNAQTGWNRRFSWPWETVINAVRVATEMPFQYQAENQSWTYLGAFILALVVGILSLRWLRGSYSVYLWAGILFPLFSATRLNPLLSYPRFLAVLFPAFMVLALAGRNRYIHQIITWASLLLLALYTIRFVNWYWVA